MRSSIEQNDGGFVMVWALLLMVVLLVLGVSGIGTSIFESQMTANDALHKQSFFQADGGSNVAAVLIEENVSCPAGFAHTQDNGKDALILGNILVPNSNIAPFYKNPAAGSTVPSDTNRDAYYFYNVADSNGTKLPRTNIKTGATTQALPGGAMEMAAGYEGRGKGLPGGGATMDFDTFSQYRDARKSQSVVEIMWQHIIGFEGSCKY